MSENENRVQRLQGLRRSNAATAIPGKRFTGPQVAEWDTPCDCIECPCCGPCSALCVNQEG